MIALNRSTCSLAFGCFSVLVNVSTSSTLQSSEKYLKVNYDLLSVSIVDSIAGMLTHVP